MGDAIAVVGMGIVAPGVNDPDDFWRVLNQGENTFGQLDHFDLRPWRSADPGVEDKAYACAAGFVRDFRPHPTLAGEHHPGRCRHPRRRSSHGRWPALSEGDLRAREAGPHRLVRSAFAGLLPEDTDLLTPDTACSPPSTPSTLA